MFYAEYATLLCDAKYIFHLLETDHDLIFKGKENLGMVMVFTLVSAGQEWLNEKWDFIKKDREEKVLAKLKADEEAELVNCCVFIKQQNL